MAKLRFEYPSHVDEANEKVPILFVLRHHGVAVPDLENSRSMKMRCIWADFHPDGGTEASMRLYADSNHAFCFAGCGVLTPVRVHADVRGVSPRQAARELLDLADIRPLHWTERLVRLEQRDDSTSRRNYAQALVTYVSSRKPHGQEYDASVVEAVRVALAELDNLASDVSSQAYQDWLERWKTQLR